MKSKLRLPSVIVPKWDGSEKFVPRPPGEVGETKESIRPKVNKTRILSKPCRYHIGYLPGYLTSYGQVPQNVISYYFQTQCYVRIRGVAYKPIGKTTQELGCIT